MHGYARWSRGLVLNGMEGLDEGDWRREFAIGVGSLWGSLVHVYGADRGWLQTVSSDPHHDFAMDVPVGISGLRAAWAEVDGGWDAFLGGLGEADLDRVIVRNSRLRNQTYEFRVGDVCLHVCTHAVHTFAQCRNMLRGCGVEEQPSNDLIFCPMDVMAGGGGGDAEPVSGPVE
jgi:uncharacterized damage-inducible protein DinB